MIFFITHRTLEYFVFFIVTLQSRLEVFVVFTCTLIGTNSDTASPPESHRLHAGGAPLPKQDAAMHPYPMKHSCQQAGQQLFNSPPATFGDFKQIPPSGGVPS